MTGALTIAGAEFGSRLILGTGGFPRMETLTEAIEATGTEMVTVAVRRIDPGARHSLLDVLHGARVRVLPNTAGDYTFHIFGTVEGTAVDQKFNSADKKFGAIADTASITFPAAPQTAGDALAKIEDLQKSVDANTAAIAKMGSSSSDSDSGSSNTLAIIALILGALGLGVGGFAVIKK